MTTLEYLPDGSGLRFSFDYNPAMIEALKATIPSTSRRFDWDSRTWLIATQYEATCAALAKQYLDVTLHTQQTFGQTAPTTELLTLKYLGAAKDRGDDQRTALGHDGAEWRYIFPEPILKQWFGIDDAPDSSNTLYAVLGIGRGAAGVEIKKAYRATIRQWHPDVCTEPNAAQVAQRINEAYNVLSNPAMRARYDAGLQLQSSLGAAAPSTDVWRPPLRCGYVLALVVPTLGRLLVRDILQWTEIVDAQGRSLVTSWRYGDDTYSERWV